MKGLEELGKLVNGKVSLADQGSQSTCLKLSLPTGNAEVTPVSMIKNSMSSTPVVEGKANSPESFDGLVSFYHRQLRHQTATFGDTSTSSVSIVRGSPSALRSLRQ